MEPKIIESKVEVDNIDFLKKQNKELRELCEKLLERIRFHQNHTNEDGGLDYCHYCGADYNFYSGFECKSDCITQTNIPD